MTVYLAHATSFCAGVWRPVIAGLAGLDNVAWDFAGHGNGPHLDRPVDWSVFGSQVLEETQPGGVGVGHSMGGAALVMAQLADPGRFRALLLIEPIIYPGPYERREHRLSAEAIDRRDDFETRDDAMLFFSSRPAFAGWDPAAIEGYVDCGLAGEDRLSLACRPEVEADVYRGSNAHETWERLDEVRVPVLLLSGEQSETVPPELTRAQASRFASAGFEIVPGAGHFLPMEKPEIVADRVRRIYEAVSPQPSAM
jgi:pimeloyl-ACP methyl ester carboxylesterase